MSDDKVKLLSAGMIITIVLYFLVAGMLAESACRQGEPCWVTPTIPLPYPGPVETSTPKSPYPGPISDDVDTPPSVWLPIVIGDTLKTR